MASKSKKDTDSGKSRQSYYLSFDLIKKVQIVSDVEGWSQNDIVTQALETYLERLEKKQGEKYPKERPGDKKGPPKL